MKDYIYKSSKDLTVQKQWPHPEHIRFFSILVRLIFNCVVIIPSHYKIIPSHYKTLKRKYVVHCKVLFHHLRASYLQKTYHVLYLLVFHISKSSRKGLFISLEVRNPTWTIWFRERLTVTRKKSLHSFTFNFQIQPGLLIFASFEFWRKYREDSLGKVALWISETACTVRLWLYNMCCPLKILN